MKNESEVRSRFTPINDKEPACERTCAKLLIYSDHLDPDEIGSILESKPTSQVFAKEPEGTYPGRANGWFLSSEVIIDSKDIRTHLDWLLRSLLPVKSNLLKLQEEDGIRMYVYCPWWAKFGSGGPSLWPEQMTALSDLNLECTIDFAYYGDQI